MFQVESFKLHLTESGLLKMRAPCAIHRVTQSHPVNNPGIPFSQTTFSWV